MQITFYFSIYTEIDFDHVHLLKIIDIVCLAYVIWKSKHKLWNASAFVVLNMFVNVNLSKFVFIHSDHVCL